MEERIFVNVIYMRLGGQTSVFSSIVALHVGCDWSVLAESLSLVRCHAAHAFLLIAGVRDTQHIAHPSGLPLQLLFPLLLSQHT